MTVLLLPGDLHQHSIASAYLPVFLLFLYQIDGREGSTMSTRRSNSSILFPLAIPTMKVIVLIFLGLISLACKCYVIVAFSCNTINWIESSFLFFIIYCFFDLPAFSSPLLF